MFGSGQVGPKIGLTIVPPGVGNSHQVGSDGTNSGTDPGEDEGTLTTAALAAQGDPDRVVATAAVAYGPQVAITVAGGPEDSTHIHRDARGHLRYILAEQASALVEFKMGAAGEVRNLGHGVFIRKSPQGTLEVLQPDIGSSGTMVDIADLVATVPNARQILFFRPTKKSADDALTRLTPFDQWMDALRALGYDIKVVNTVEGFTREIRGQTFDIICFSSYSWTQLSAAFRAVKNLSPNSITLLGGHAAQKEAAASFDIVALSDDSFAGEGEILLPLILRRLQELIATAPVKEGPPVLFREKFPQLSANPLPDDTKQFTQSAYWTPPLKRGVAQAIAHASAMRFINADAGRPSREVQLLAGAEIFIRSARMPRKEQVPVLWNHQSPRQTCIG